MELTESIPEINRQLTDLYGIDTITGLTIFRVVWAENQLEKKLMNTTDSGIILLHPEVREVPKYPWIKGKYILERLVLVPEVNAEELPSQKLSYEPIWVFEGKNGEAVPPIMLACKFIVDTLYAALGKSGLRKYVDEEAKNPVEHREKRIAKLEEELFGDESFLLGRTITGEAIAMPPNYEKSQQTKEN